MGVGGSITDMQTYVSQHLLTAAVGSGVAANDPAAWRGAFTIPLNNPDSLAAIPNTTVRALRRKHPATLAALLYNAIRVLDRTTALQLGVERYISAKYSAANGTTVSNAATPTAADADATATTTTSSTIDEDLFTALLFFDEAQYALEKDRQKQRRARNATEIDKKLAEIGRKHAAEEAKRAKAAAAGAAAATESSPADPANTTTAPQSPLSIPRGGDRFTGNGNSASPNGVTTTPTSPAAANDIFPVGVIETPRPFGDLYPAEQRAFMNALALIYRIMPVVLEEDQDRVSPNVSATTNANNNTTTAGQSPYTQADAAAFSRTFLKSFFVENRTCFGAEPTNAVSNSPTAASAAGNNANNTADNFSSETLSSYAKNKDPTLYFTDASRPLGEILVNVLLRCAFVPGFTIDASQKVSNERPINLPLVDSGLVWAPGVGFSANKSAPWTKAEWSVTNRRTVLAALLSTLSGALYASDCTPSAKLDVFMDTITDPQRCPLASTLVCSLLNVVCSYSTFGSLPFSSHFVGQVEHLVFSCAETLNVLLNTQKLFPQRPNAAIIPNTPSNEGSNPTLSKLTAPSISSFAAIVMRKYHTAWPVLCLASGSEVSFVLKGLLHLVNNRTYSKSTRVPGTQRRLAHHDAFFLLMWKLVDRCSNFFEPLTTDPDVALPFIIPLLDYGLAAMENGQLFSNAQIVAFTLMRLSGSRDFSIVLNAPINTHIPFKCPALPHGSYNDLVIVSVLQLLHTRQQTTTSTGADKKGPATANATTTAASDATNKAANRLASSGSSLMELPSATSTVSTAKATTYRPTPTAIMTIHETCATIICNLSPYVTNLLTTTALNLMSFFELAVRPSWLVLHPSYPNILMLIVESFANILQYQYRACPTLLYNLCRERAKLHRVYKEITDPLKAATTKRTAVGENGAPSEQSSPAPISLVGGGSGGAHKAGDATAASPSDLTSTSAMAADANAKPTHLTLSADEVIPMRIRERIKIGTLLCAVDAAEPILVRAIAKNPTIADPVSILNNTTLVGLLPAPHPIIVRRFEPHPSTDAWTTAVMWGFIYTNDKHIADPHKIRLFTLQAQ